MALDGTINLTISQPILDEMAVVLARKFYATPEEIAEATLLVRDATDRHARRAGWTSSGKIRRTTEF